MTRLNTSAAESSVSRTFRNPLDGPITLIARRFGGKSREVERFLRFAVVGITGAVLDFGILIILQATLLPPVNEQKEPLVLNVALATSLAFFTAVASNFVWTRLWVYPDSRSRSVRRQLGQFALISFTGGVARTTWISLACIPLGTLLMPAVLPAIQLFRPGYLPSHTAEAKLGTIVAQMIGIAVVMLWNFLANRYWTYSDVH
jgi:putative flippase GtrA